MTKKITWAQFERQRKAILAEAIALGVPAFATPMWKRLYAK